MNLFSYIKFHSIHIFALLLFLGITILYCWPIIEGKKIKSHDYKQFLGMSKEIVDYRTATGEEALWTNSMFGGMPAYQISVHYANNILVHIDKFFQLYFPRPIGIIFLYFLGFYFLLLVLKIDPGLSVVGALGFGLSSYLFIILEAGHNTKAHAIAYIAPVVASMIYCFTKENRTIWQILRCFFMAFLFMGLQIRANHFQITYYLLFILLFFWTYYLIINFKKHRKLDFLKKTILFSMAGVMAILINIGNIWSTYEYSKYTIRGDSDLLTESSGLDKEYATAWSYGKLETFNLLYPNFVGGASNIKWSEDSNIFKFIYKNTRRKGANAKEAKLHTNQYLKQLPAYFGPQPMTSGPVYIGAVMWLLFFIALFTLKKPIKYVLLLLTLCSFFIAWGKNFSFLSDFLLNFLPLFNKFRTPSMALVIAQFAIPLLGLIGLNKLVFSQSISIIEKRRVILKSVGSIIVLSIFFLLFKNLLLDFRFPFVDVKSNEPILLELVKDRINLFNSDIIRSSIFVFFAGIAVYKIVALVNDNSLLSQTKQTFSLPTILLISLVIFDMWFVNKRYLNSDDFDLIENVEKPYVFEEFDKNLISNDTTIYRVYDRLQFNNTRSSFFHHSLGGYHAAKLRTYQNVIEKYINIDSPNEMVINMLNAKYIIDLNSEGTSLMTYNNINALGNAWFVDTVQWVNNTNEELDQLHRFNPKKTVIINSKYQKQINQSRFEINGSVDLITYEPNRLVYNMSSEKSSFVVFSEIFYPKGWKAYIDGNFVEHFPVNYILRGLVVPSGAHEIVFEFKPKSFFVSAQVSLFASCLLIITGLITCLRLFVFKE